MIYIFIFAATDNYSSGNLHMISYYDFQTLRKATNKFHQTNLLGRGGFGPVYLVYYFKTSTGRFYAIDS